MPHPRAKAFETPWIDELKDLWQKRDPHVQKILEPFFPDRPNFPGTQFIAYIVKDIKTRPNGETDITFTVPFEFADEAATLRKALTVPLSIDIQTWKPYEEAMRGDGGGEGLAEPPSDSEREEAS